jgi:very-short-patch-repair endonuclease
MNRNRIIPYNPKLKEFARILRKQSTLSEILLWKEIKTKAYGVEFHRQVPLLNYIVDFYCHELKLAIEIDGNSHDHKLENDIERQNELEEYGISFLRFSDLLIKKDMFNTLRALEMKIDELKNKTFPLPPSKGESGLRNF